MNGYNPDKQRRKKSSKKDKRKLIRDDEKATSSAALLLANIDKAATHPFKSVSELARLITSIHDFKTYKDALEKEAKQHEQNEQWSEALGLYRNLIDTLMHLNQSLKTAIVTYDSILAFFKIKLACCHANLGQMTEYRKWVKLSGGLGHPLVVYHYAKLLIDIHLVPFNKDKINQALRMLNEASKGMLVTAEDAEIRNDIFFLLGVTNHNIYLIDRANPKFLEAARSWLEPILEHDLRAKFFYVQKFVCQLDKNFTRAVALLQEIIKSGKANDESVVSAHAFVGSMYDHGFEGVPQNDEKAFQHLLAAAKQGHVHAQHDVALMLQKGQGILADHKQAVTWYQNAANQGNTDSQNNLALLYLEHPDCCPDEKDAAYWFMQAASQNLNMAYHNLAMESYKKTIACCDFAISARFWWKLGWLNTRASHFAYNLGTSFISLPFPGINPNRAIFYLDQVPDTVQEYTKAQLLLVKLYEYKTIDDESKAEHYRQLSKQAQTNSVVSATKQLEPQLVTTTVATAQVIESVQLGLQNAAIDLDKANTHSELMSLLAKHGRKPASRKAKSIINFKVETCDSYDTALILYNLGEICRKQLSSDRRILDQHHQRILIIIDHVSIIIHNAQAAEIAMMLDGIIKLSLHPELPIVGKVLNMLYQTAIIELEQFSLMDLTAVICSLGRTQIAKPLLPFYVAALIGQAEKLISDPKENVTWQVLTMLLYTCMILEESLRDTHIANEFNGFVEFLINSINQKFKFSKDLDHRASMQLHMVERYFAKQKSEICKLFDPDLARKALTQVSSYEQKDDEVDDVSMIEDPPEELCTNIYTVLGVEEIAEAKPPEKVSDFQQTVFDFVVNYFPNAKHDTEKVHGLPVDIYIETPRGNFSLQVDGTTHFWHRNPGEPPELNHKSRINTTIVGNCARVAYFEWNKCKTDDQRYDFIKGLVEEVCFTMPPKIIADKKPLAAVLAESSPLIASTLGVQGQQPIASISAAAAPRQNKPLGKQG